MNGSGETRWMDDPELPSQILSTPIVPTPDTVTITISREAAEAFANLDNACTWDGCTAAECVIERALRAALEEER